MCHSPHPGVEKGLPVANGQETTLWSVDPTPRPCMVPPASVTPPCDAGAQNTSDGTLCFSPGPPSSPRDRSPPGGCVSAGADDSTPMPGLSGNRRRTDMRSSGDGLVGQGRGPLPGECND